MAKQEQSWLEEHYDDIRGVAKVILIIIAIIIGYFILDHHTSNNSKDYDPPSTLTEERFQ